MCDWLIHAIHRSSNLVHSLGFTVDCPGTETISAQSTYQANEFAVFVPAETGTCTVAVTRSGIDTPRRSQQDYAIASTLPLSTVDIAAPRPTISTTEPSPTNVHNITFMVDFGEQVNRTTFTASDVSASGGTVSDPLPANSTAGTFTFKISDINTGNLTVSISEGGVLDPAGNGNTASDLYVAEIKRPCPSPVISTAEPSHIHVHSVTFTVDFGEPINVDTFTASDVSASSGTVSDPLPAGGDDTEFTFEVSSLAAGFGWVSRKSGVCFATSCLGATNILTGIASPCRFCPMVAITGQVPVAMIGRDTFQESDIIGIKLFHNLYKHVCVVAKIQRSRAYEWDL